MKTAREWARELVGGAFEEDIEKIQQDARAELVEVIKELISIIGTADATQRLIRGYGMVDENAPVFEKCRELGFIPVMVSLERKTT
jgi:hypothetical protein